MVKVVFHARNQVVEHKARDGEALHGVLECQEHGVGGPRFVVARRELLPEEEELRDFVQVGLLVQHRLGVLVLLERLTVGLGFRVHLSERAGEAVGPVAVRNVVCTAAEGIHCAHGLPLVLWEVLERVIEIAGLASGQFLTIGVGQAEKFGRGLLGPDGGLEVSKGIDEFQIVTEQADELGRLAKRFHRRLADGLDGLCGQLNTGAQPLKRRELLALEASALRRCVALEGQHEVEGLPAFQHLRRLCLSSCPYESPVFKREPTP